MTPAQPPPKPVEPGLYLVATPIGNLRDITLRALDVLAACDLVLAEDTRVAAKLLSAFGLSKKLERYDEHGAERTRPRAMAALAEGARVALVSDAGTPLVSDPGYRLVTLCVRHKIPVVPIPGPSAMLAALAAAGLPNEEFLFVGFLPQRSGERRRMLEHLRIEERTIIFYEAPHRVAESIADAQELLGARPACI